MTKKKESQVFYAGIQDPIEIRKSLLESSKEMLQMLQRHEKFKEVRREKHDNIVLLKSDIKEIQKLFVKLKTSLPLTHLRIMLKQERERNAKIKAQKVKNQAKKDKKKGKKAIVAKVKAVKDEVVKSPMTKRELSELEKLESELSEIESKLGSLV